MEHHKCHFILHVNPRLTNPFLSVQSGERRVAESFGQSPWLEHQFVVPVVCYDIVQYDMIQYDMIEYII